MYLTHVPFLSFFVICAATEKKTVCVGLSVVGRAPLSFIVVVGVVLHARKICRAGSGVGDRETSIILRRVGLFLFYDWPCCARVCVFSCVGEGG